MGTNVQTGTFVLVLLAFVLFGFPRLKEMYGSWRLWKRNRQYEKMAAELRKIGRVLCYNHVDDVMAVCKFSAFAEALDEHLRAEQEGGPGMWRKALVEVHPLYTFAERDEVFHNIHTGRRKDIERILGILVWNLLDHKYDQKLLRGNTLKSLVKIIAKEDTRLYVPFTGDKYLPEWGSYPGTTLGEAYNTLVSEIRREHGK